MGEGKGEKPLGKPSFMEAGKDEKAALLKTYP
jgi:hypothetical protein